MSYAEDVAQSHDFTQSEMRRHKTTGSHMVCWRPMASLPEGYKDGRIVVLWEDGPVTGLWGFNPISGGYWMDIEGFTITPTFWLDGLLPPERAS